MTEAARRRLSAMKEAAGIPTQPPAPIIDATGPLPPAASPEGAEPPDFDPLIVELQDLWDRRPPHLHEMSLWQHLEDVRVVISDSVPGRVDFEIPEAVVDICAVKAGNLIQF